MKSKMNDVIDMGNKMLIERPLYDTVYSKPGELIEKFTFFDTSLDCRKYGFASCNMECESFLPAGHYFHVKGIEVRDSEGLTAFVKRASLCFLIGSTQYINLPLENFWHQNNKNPHNLKCELLLVPLQNFCVFVNMKHPVQFNFPYSLRCILHGDYYCPVA